MKKRLAILVVAFGLLPLSTQALTKAERKEAKNLLSGTLYLRIDAPWETGVMAFGVSIKEPLVDVSPTEVRSERTGRLVFWQLGVNDAARLEDFEIEDDGAVHIDLEAVGDEEQHGVLHFIGISNLADFKAAFDRAFSRVPLQDEFPDWPLEVRKAVAERRLVDGMTKRQAYAVVGPPSSFEEFEQQGKKIEVWRLKMNRGPRYAFLFSMSGTPGSIRFEDGQLVGVGARRAGGEVNLDQ